MKKIVILLTLLSLYGCDTEFEVRTNNGNSDVNEKIFESKNLFERKKISSSPGPK